MNTALARAGLWSTADSHLDSSAQAHQERIEQGAVALADRQRGMADEGEVAAWLRVGLRRHVLRERLGSSSASHKACARGSRGGEASCCIPQPASEIRNVLGCQIDRDGIAAIGAADHEGARSYAIRIRWSAASRRRPGASK